MSSQSNLFQGSSTQGSAASYYGANTNHCTTSVDYSQYPYSAPITNYLNEPLTLTERVAGGLPPDPHRERLEAHLKDLGETIKGSKKPHRSKKPRETSSRGR